MTFRMDPTGRRMRKGMKAILFVYLACGIAYAMSVQMRPYGAVRTLDAFDSRVSARYRMLALAWTGWTVAFWPGCLWADYKWR